jgi:hypothetical protein
VPVVGDGHGGRRRGDEEEKSQVGCTSVKRLGCLGPPLRDGLINARPQHTALNLRRATTAVIIHNNEHTLPFSEHFDPLSATSSMLTAIGIDYLNKIWFDFVIQYPNNILNQIIKKSISLQTNFWNLIARIRFDSLDPIMASFNCLFVLYLNACCYAQNITLFLFSSVKT